MIILGTRGNHLCGMGDLDPSQLVPDRGELRSETDALLAAIKQLGADQFNTDTDSITQDQLTTWNSFVNEVQSWDSGPDFITHISNGAWLSELVAYQKQFNTFLGTWKAAGVATSLAPFGFSSKPGIIDKAVGAAGDAVKAAEDAAKKTAQTIEIVAIVGGVTVVGLIGYLIWESGRTVRSIGPHIGARI